MQFDRLKRRQFITLLGGAVAAWPFAARAQLPAIPVIAFLGVTAPDPNADYLRTFRQGLKESGFVEGENVTIIYSWAEGQIDRLPKLASDLARRQVAAIITAGDATALAAMLSARADEVIE